ncbi:DUF3800 domain-containing protein [Gracilinema caldarium]|uniref:DUF3800 domain-containing protein n=1 Tax=Gracilinema caldarium (strain ATCC 51460 / DSM 7334 / H1) TaxID=744872 RepID=F8F307_GRAC1|nr:DUF3800 domain-containing protein [Gracilinema caldarium]AEJ19915.1 hypothetical protein Spica_1773 [Gracilinema caldarium DSM 7334]
MGNTLILDESKVGDGSLFCFAGILYKDQTTFLQIDSILASIKNRHDLANANAPIELKGNKISTTIDRKKEALLDELFKTIQALTLSGSVSIRFYIMQKDDLNYANVNLENVINKILEKNTSIDKKKVQTYLYYQLSSLLIKRIHELPFKKSFIETVICDNIYNMRTTSKSIIWARGNIASIKIDINTIVPMIIEAVHNKLPTPKHYGFKFLDFYDSTSLVSIQLCDILSNFIMNSIRHMYFISIGDATNAALYKAKYDFLNKYIDISNLPITEIPLTAAGNDISCSNVFLPFMGKM